MLQTILTVMMPCVLCVTPSFAATATSQSVPSLPRPTHADMKYGPHERNVLDAWLVYLDGPTGPDAERIRARFDEARNLLLASDAEAAE